MQKEERTPAPKTEWHKGVRVKLCGAKCLLGTGETLDHEPLTLRAPWFLLYLDQSDPYILGTSHSKTIIIFYIVVWVFFWKATCPKNPSLSVNEKSHLSLWLLLFKLEGAWILEKRLCFFMLLLFRTLSFVILNPFFKFYLFWISLQTHWYLAYFKMTLLSNPGWPQIHDSPLSSASLVLGLQGHHRS